MRYRSDHLAWQGCQCRFSPQLCARSCRSMVKAFWALIISDALDGRATTKLATPPCCRNAVRYRRMYLRTFALVLASAIAQPGLAAQDNSVGETPSAPTPAPVAPQGEPTAASGFIARGNTAFNAGQIDEAIQNYSRALDVDPSNAVAYYERGNAYLSRRQFDKALADFAAAIDRNFAGELAYLNRGIVYAQTGVLDLALKDLNAAAHLNPTSAEVYYNRGLLYMRAANFEAAIADFSTATKLNPRHADAFAARGAARQSIGQITEATRDYYTALELDPKNRNALVNLRKLGLLH